MEGALETSTQESAQTLELREKLRKRERPAHIGLRTLLFLVSFSAFIWVMRDQGPVVVAVIVGVVLFHEAGHFVAMKLLGYENMKVFFIPLIGAAVSGRAVKPDGWQTGIVSLAGPVPGIIVAALLAPSAQGNPLMRTIVMTLLFINSVNLLPFLPLDGGRVMNAVLFARHRYLEMTGALIGTIGLVAVPGLLPGSPAVWAGVMVGFLFNRARIIDATHELRARNLPLDGPTSALPEAALWSIHAAMDKVLGGAMRTERGDLATVAMLHESAATRPAPWKQSLNLGAAWIGVLVLAWMSWNTVQHPTARWRHYTNPATTWSTDFPAEPTLIPMERIPSGLSNAYQVTARIDGVGEFLVVSAVIADPRLRLEQDPAGADKRMSAMIDETVKGTGWTLVSDDITTHASWPARKVVYRTQAGISLPALYVAGGREVDTISTVSASASDAAKFVDSFRVLR